MALLQQQCVSHHDAGWREELRDLGARSAEKWRNKLGTQAMEFQEQELLCEYSRGDLTIIHTSIRQMAQRAFRPPSDPPAHPRSHPPTQPTHKHTRVHTGARALKLSILVRIHGTSAHIVCTQDSSISIRARRSEVPGDC